MDLKLEVADEYQQSSARCGGGRPNLSQIAAKFNVHWNFVKKIEDELWKYNRVLPPEEIRANQDRPVGPGSQSLCQFELFIIVRLLWEDPSRHLRSYRDWVLLLTGNKVSMDTISQVLLRGFPHMGNLLKPNLIPLDKFKPENIVRSHEYLTALFTLHPEKVVFVDEKHLRGEELFNQKVRRCVMTGNVPSILTDSDFRIAYSITAFCSINTRKAAPVWHRIYGGTNSAEEFRVTCERALRDGFFEPYDVIVADNATIHNDVEELLWECCRVLVIFLPTRTPEWNPKELIWAVLVKRMGNMPLTALHVVDNAYEGTDSSIVVKAASYVLDRMTFGEVCKHYSHCYNFFPHWKELRNRTNV